MAENTEVQPAGPKKDQAATPDPVAVGARGAVIDTMAKLSRMAAAMVRGGITPPKMTAESAFAVMACGMELGLSPIQSLRDIAFINGRPSVYGDGIPALLFASGQLADMPTVAWRTTGEHGMECTVTLKRKGYETPVSRTFTQEDAKLAGLWGKAGPWTQYPKRMLYWRALSWAARDGFGDVLKGVWGREEAEDIPVATQEPSGYSVNTVQIPREWQDWQGVKGMLRRDQLFEILDLCGVEVLTMSTDPDILKRAHAEARAMVGMALPIAPEEKKEENDGKASC